MQAARQRTERSRNMTEDAIHLVHLSDLHFGAHEAALAERLGLLLRRERPQLVIASGDFSYHARRAEFAQARRWLDGLDCPWHGVPGNHDSPAMNQPLARVFQPFARYRRLLCPEAEPAWRGEGVAVLGLNSSRPVQPRLDWSTGRLGRAQLRRLGDWAGSQEPGTLRVLSIHHPLARPEGNRRALVSPAPRILEALGRAKIDLVCSGHFHQPLLATLDAPGFRPLLSLASTAISHRLKGSPNGFQVIRGHPGSLRIEGWVWDRGDYRLERGVSARRDADGWTLLAADDQPRHSAPGAELEQEVELDA